MDKEKYFKRLQQTVLLFILGPVPIDTTNANSAHIACVGIQITSKAPNEGGRYATCIHALASLVGREWWLLQSGKIAAWRISMNLYASRAVQQIFWSGD